jgi:hypothetical protein
MEIARAGQLDVESRRIWIPPTGKPFWIDLSGNGRHRDLTEAEMRRYLVPDPPIRPVIEA